VKSMPSYFWNLFWYFWAVSEENVLAPTQLLGDPAGHELSGADRSDGREGLLDQPRWG
jgi:hypothetical protein